jgi:hypothetical protein
MLFPVVGSSALDRMRRALFGAATLWTLAACARSELELEPGESSAPTVESGGTVGQAAAGRGGGAPHAGSSSGASGTSALGGAGTSGRASGGRGGEAPAGAGGAAGHGGRAAAGASGRGNTGGVAGNAGFGGRSRGGRGGFAGSSGAGGFGGASGFGGTGGFAGAKTLPRCDLLLTPRLDGPPASDIQADAQTAVSGDFNRDGRLDLATLNLDGSVRLLFGQGDGSLSAAATYATSLVPSEVSAHLAAADLDENGSLDLVAVIGSSQMTILFGASGAFPTRSSFSFVDEVTALALGDFDGNGAQDIALAMHTTGQNDAELRILLGDGTGSFGNTFAPVISATRETTIGDLAVADVNEDGIPDLVGFGDNIGVFLGDGNGTFSEVTDLEGSIYSGWLGIGDFDNDGHADIFANYDCSWQLFPQGSSELWLGHGDGTFSTGTLFQTTECLGAIAIGDVNDDGKTDVIGSPTTVLLGTGDGGFLPEVRSPGALSGALMSAGDFNADGKLDVAAASGTWVAVHLGNGDGTFGPLAEFVTGKDLQSLVISDFDGDGVLDVVTTGLEPFGSTGPSSVTVWHGVGDGTFVDHADYQASPLLSSIGATDLDGDSRLDLVAAGNSSVVVLLGRGGGNFAPAAEYDTGYVNTFALGDMNGDIHPDVVVAKSGGLGLSLLFGHGDGTLEPARALSIPGDAFGLTLLDANRDSRLDIAYTTYSNPSGDPNGTVTILPGIGDGGFQLGRGYLTGNRPREITAGDLNHDGQPDLVAATGDPDSAVLSVLLGRSDGSFGPPLDYTVEGQHVGIADFNRDGLEDIVVSNPGLEVLLGAGDGTFTCFEQFVPGVSLGNVGIGDLNHDGRLDVVTTTTNGLDVFMNH